MYGLQFRSELPGRVAQELEGLIAAIKRWGLTEHNEDGTHLVPTPITAVPVGAIFMWGAASPPTKWLICDGSQVSRVDYKTLFDIIGTTYGVGNGTTTFNLPDLRGRFALGKAAAGTGSSLAATGGAIDHTHSMGSHTHSISSDGGHAHGGSTGSDGSHQHAVSLSTSVENGFDTQAGTGATRTDTHQHTVSGNTDAGGSHSHSIGSDGSHSHGGNTGSASAGTSGTANPPFQVVNYIILAGV